MTAAVSVKEAVRVADNYIYNHTQGTWAERVMLHRRVHSLRAAGWLNQEIALRVGLSKDHVSRILAVPQPPITEVPRTPSPHSINAARAEEMAKLMDVVLGLACRMRDEDPAGVYLALRMLPHESLVETCMVAIAGIRDDATISELYGWCYQPAETTEDQA